MGGLDKNRECSDTFVDIKKNVIVKVVINFTMVSRSFREHLY